MPSFSLPAYLENQYLIYTPNLSSLTGHSFYLDLSRQYRFQFSLSRPSSDERMIYITKCRLCSGLEWQVNYGMNLAAE